MARRANVSRATPTAASNAPVRGPRNKRRDGGNGVPVCNARVLGIVLALLGCGSVSPSANTPERKSAPTASVTSSCNDDLGSPTRRLTRFELAYAVEDVLSVAADELRQLPAPVSSIGDVPDILVGPLLDTSEQFLKPYRAAVQRITEAAAARHSAECRKSDAVAHCLRTRLERAAVRCWRSRVSAEEIADLERADANEATKSDEPAASYQRGLSRVLLSKRFYLLQNETVANAPEVAARRTLSRLALVLWSSVPDYPQVIDAEAGALNASHRFEQLVSDMLADARFRRFSREFTRQWLRLDRRAMFRPSLTERGLVEDAQLLQQLVEEAADLVHARSQRPLVELLGASESEGVSQAGLLTSKALLSAISSPIRGGGDEIWLGRGLVVQSAFLCRTFPLAAVYDYKLWQAHPLLDPHLTAETPRPSETELLAIRTRDRPCRECHRQLETIGAVLARYDGFGKASLTAASGATQVAGYDVRNARELSAWVQRSQRFQPCVAQKLASYVLGRAILPERRAEDRCRVRELVADESASLESVLWRTLTSPAFRSQGSQVVRDQPTTLPDSRLYTEPLKVEPSANCGGFVPGEFLVQNCGSAACHGVGTRGALFAVPDSAQVAAFLKQGRPRRDGYCAHIPGYLDAERPLESLVIRKVTAGGELCGAPMPITGGPRSLSPHELSCFVNWVSGLTASWRKDTVAP